MGVRHSRDIHNLLDLEELMHDPWVEEVSWLELVDVVVEVTHLLRNARELLDELLLWLHKLVCQFVYLPLFSLALYSLVVV